MVSKRNSVRKKDSIEDSTPKEKAEPKPEVNVNDIIKQVAQKVVEELKPDMVNKINETTQQLAKQIAEEIKDIRSSISQPRPSAYAEQQPPLEQQPEIATEQPTGQPEIQQPKSLIEMILPYLLQQMNPKPQTNAQMFQTFEQAQIRKNMADMSMDDYINRAVKQKMLKQILGNGWNKDDFEKAQKTADHYMKPLRDVGVNAEKAEQLKHIQQEREKSNE